MKTTASLRVSILTVRKLSDSGTRVNRIWNLLFASVYWEHCFELSGRRNPSHRRVIEIEGNKERHIRFALSLVLWRQ